MKRLVIFLGFIILCIFLSNYFSSNDSKTTSKTNAPNINTNGVNHKSTDNSTNTSKNAAPYIDANGVYHNIQPGGIEAPQNFESSNTSKLSNSARINLENTLKSMEKNLVDMHKLYNTTTLVTQKPFIAQDIANQERAIELIRKQLDR